jgi:hypothetical protein
MNSRNMNEKTPAKREGIFSSTIIATIGRLTLARAIESVLSQDVQAPLEVIVVNDSGCPLPRESWHDSEWVRIVNTMKRERCVARNTGAAIARGDYLHFLDDDDWLLPGAMREFWTIAQSGSAALIYGATQFVDKNLKPTWKTYLGEGGHVFAKVMSHHWIPLQSSLVKAECFWAAGGFDLRLAGLEQKDLTRRVALQGPFIGTPAVVSCVMQDRAGSTSDHNLSSEFSVRSRDKILDERGSFRRMMSSAKTPYWRGKVVRAYLTCVVRNLKKGHILKAVSRSIRAAAGILLSAPYMISTDFWKALVGVSSNSKAPVVRLLNGRED